MAVALFISALTMIGTLRRIFSRKLVPILAIAGLLAFAGCGDDDEEPAATGTATAPAETATEETAPAETDEETETAETETEPRESPEDGEGGAGDEEPARVLALFTGRDGRITPRVVRVPAFISIRVELRSADGREYGLKFDGEGIKVTQGLSSVSTTIDGLRPREAVVGVPDGEGTRVRIEATAEPGP